MKYTPQSKDKIGIRHLPPDDARHQSPEHLRRRGGLQLFHSHFKFPVVDGKTVSTIIEEEPQNNGKEYVAD